MSSTPIAEDACPPPPSDECMCQHYPLQREWRMLVFKDWKQQHVVSTWTSVKDLWSCMNHVPEPSSFRMPINFAIFHSESAMTWEHPSNARGGRWIIPIANDIIVNNVKNVNHDKNVNNKKLVDSAWLFTILNCVRGSDIGNNITIHGIVINIRAAGHRINIWTDFDTDAAKGNYDALRAHGESIKLALQLPPDIKIEFKKHSDVETETYKAKSIVIV